MTVNDIENKIRKSKIIIEKEIEALQQYLEEQGMVMKLELLTECDSDKDGHVLNQKIKCFVKVYFSI